MTDLCVSLLINQPLLNPGIRVDPPVTQKRPMRAVLVHAFPFNVSDHQLFAIDGTLRHNLAARRADKTLSPKLNPVPSSGRFMSDTIARADIAAVRNRVTALHRLP